MAHRWLLRARVCFPRRSTALTRASTRHSANPEHARANPEHGCACAISFLSFLRVFRGGPVPLRGYVWGAGSRNLSSLTLSLPIVSGRAALYLCPLFSAVLRHARGHRWGSWRRPHPALAPPELLAPVQRISLSRGKVTCRCLPHAARRSGPKVVNLLARPDHDPCLFRVVGGPGPFPPLLYLYPLFLGCSVPLEGGPPHLFSEPLEWYMCRGSQA